MPSYTFDPSEDTATPEQQAAETAALEQGEKLIAAQEEDRARRMETVSDENEDMSLIGGKFKSQEDLLKAYNELQKKLGSEESSDEEETSEETVEASEEVEEIEISEARKVIEEAAGSYNNNGELSESDIEQLSKMDSKELIEAYMSFYKETASSYEQAEIAADQQKAIKQIAGGEEGYSELMQWASQSLDPTEIEAFNNVAGSGNVAAMRFAVEALNNRYRNAEGYEAPLVTGKKAAPSVKSYRSHAELARDIADPRYQSDPAFRADVERKLAASGDLM